MTTHADIRTMAWNEIGKLRKVPVPPFTKQPDAWVAMVWYNPGANPSDQIYAAAGIVTDLPGDMQEAWDRMAANPDLLYVRFENAHRQKIWESFNGNPSPVISGERGNMTATSIGRGGGGFRRHHGGVGRRHFGGPWGGWGGYYGYGPEVLVVEEEDEPFQIVGNDPTAGRGGATTAARWNGSLADLFPVLAPGARGLTAQFSLGKGGILEGTICIDGRCYKRAIDLNTFAQWIVNAAIRAHDALHARPDIAPLLAQAGTVVATQGAAQDAARVAGACMIGAAMDEHELVISSGWWHSLTHGISHAVSSVGSTVAHTLKKLKAPIQVASAAAAVAFVGPQAGPVAAQLSGSLIDAANGDGNAQQVIAAAQQAAQSSPQVAEALGAAQKAVAQTTAGFHALDTVQQAADGNPAAIQQVQQLAKDAAGGDSAAQQVIGIVGDVTNALGAGGAPTVSSGFKFLPGDRYDPSYPERTIVSGAGILPYAIAMALGAGGTYAWHRLHRRGAAPPAPGSRPQTPGEVAQAAAQK